MRLLIVRNRSAILLTCTIVVAVLVAVGTIFAFRAATASAGTNRSGYGCVYAFNRYQPEQGYYYASTSGNFGQFGRYCNEVNVAIWNYRSLDDWGFFCIGVYQVAYGKEYDGHVGRFWWPSSPPPYEPCSDHLGWDQYGTIWGVGIAFR
jgi:hypothetical protein